VTFATAAGKAGGGTADPICPSVPLVSSCLYIQHLLNTQDSAHELPSLPWLSLCAMAAERNSWALLTRARLLTFLPVLVPRGFHTPWNRSPSAGAFGRPEDPGNGSGSRLLAPLRVSLRSLMEMARFFTVLLSSSESCLQCGQHADSVRQGGF
jgi:hypothetical protein